MWFKQIKVYQLSGATSYFPNALKKLEELAFKPCLPSMAYSAGWIAPVDEEGAPLYTTLNGNTMLCLQIEEKILPATVVMEALRKRIKEIEAKEERRVRQKEKMALKDEITAALLTRAFSKLTSVYAYIDTAHHWLILGTQHEKKAEQFISFFKRAVTEQVAPITFKHLPAVLTQWLSKASYPSAFGIEKSCLLQDPAQQGRIIRCQQQDLFAQGIQALLKDGCLVKQLALSWYERIRFILRDDFSLQAIKYQDEVIAAAKEMEPETTLQQFNADFLIMSGALSELLKALFDVFTDHTPGNKKQVTEEMIAV